MANEPHLEPSLFTAKALIAWRGLGVPRVPEAVILTHQESLFSALAPRFRAQKVEGLFPQVRLLPTTNGRIAVAGRIGVGGPATAMAVEELADAGAKRIVMVDVAANITEGCVAGDAMVVEEAVAADGTSKHYLPAGTELVAADAALFSTVLGRLQNADKALDIRTTSRGRVASLDAPFRETSALLDALRGLEARLVDMETAALFASARACGVRAASVLVVGDQLLDAWGPPADLSVVRKRLLQVAEVVKAELLA
jgi:uridine phosphorylase